MIYPQAWQICFSANFSNQIVKQALQKAGFALYFIFEVNMETDDEQVEKLK
jgi:hypothetical protein